LRSYEIDDDDTISQNPWKLKLSKMHCISFQFGNIIFQVFYDLTEENRVQIVRYRFMDSDNYHILQHIQVTNANPN
jgi:hypothetical protein